SQLQNKETALGILRSKLVQLQLEQHVQNLADIKGPSQSAEWGSQIRSYVLHPYKQVKDLRTGYETTDPQSVLDGNLDPLISSWLENGSLDQHHKV
ncbi:MAG: peptide chain release factor-like protein, partial [Patescibacteria group bacterium]